MSLTSKSSDTEPFGFHDTDFQSTEKQIAAKKAKAAAAAAKTARDVDVETREPHQ